MRDPDEERLLSSTAEGWWLGTFHSACADFAQTCRDCGSEIDFTILDTDDQLHIKQLMELENLDQKRWAPRAAAIINRWKNESLRPNQIDAAPTDDFC